MDEKDYQIQKLVRTNLALLGELSAIKMCCTCVHDDEKEEHCEEPMLGLYECPMADGYQWRGETAYNEWKYKQELMEEKERESQREEEAFERRMGE